MQRCFSQDVDRAEFRSQELQEFKSTDSEREAAQCRIASPYFIGTKGEKGELKEPGVAGAQEQPERWSTGAAEYWSA